MTDHIPGFVGSHNPKLSALRILDKAQFIRLIVKAMSDQQGDVKATANKLGIGRTTMLRWLKDHGELKVALDRIREAAKGK